MKCFILILTIFLLAVHCNGKKTYVSNLVLADAYVLLDNGTYYAYGTHSPNGIEVYTSSNLKDWKLSPKLALHKKNTTETQKFWAPEVLKKDNKYYMFYSANEHIYVAVSDHPLGPFRQVTPQPLLEHGSIDCSPYIDDDGRAYLFFVYFHKGNEIYSAELTNDWLHLKPETMHKCLSVSQSWETDEQFPNNNINEGPCIIKKDGIYYLSYSANHYLSKKYGVGYATSKSINGPWVKYSGNPILQNALGRNGTGHHSFFTNKKGKMMMIYHAHYSDTQVHPRVSYFAKLKINKGILSLKTIK